MQNIAQYTLSDYEIEITIDRAGEGTFWTRFNLKGKNILTKIKEFLPTKDNTVPVLISLIALNQSGGQNVRIENNYVVINNNIKLT